MAIKKYYCKFNDLLTVIVTVKTSFISLIIRHFTV